VDLMFAVVARGGLSDPIKKKVTLLLLRKIFFVDFRPHVRRSHLEERHPSFRVPGSICIDPRGGFLC